MFDKYDLAFDYKYSKCNSCEFDECEYYMGNCPNQED